MGYISKSLNETKRNYNIHDKEISVAIIELENWKYLLKCARFKFKVQTDHRNLKYFMKVQNSNCKQAHYVLYLPIFDFTLKHVPRTGMEKVDILNRRLD